MTLFYERCLDTSKVQKLRLNFSFCPFVTPKYSVRFYTRMRNRVIKIKTLI